MTAERSPGGYKDRSSKSYVEAGAAKRRVGGDCRFLTQTDSIDSCVRSVLRSILRSWLAGSVELRVASSPVERNRLKLLNKCSQSRSIAERPVRRARARNRRAKWAELKKESRNFAFSAIFPNWPNNLFTPPRLLAAARASLRVVSA